MALGVGRVDGVGVLGALALDVTGDVPDCPVCMKVKLNPRP